MPKNSTIYLAISVKSSTFAPTFCEAEIAQLVEQRIRNA